MNQGFNGMFVRRAMTVLLSAGLTLALALAQDKPMRIGGNVMQANLITPVVKPIYPPEAKQKRVEGTVRLEVTIDKDGHVSQIAIVSGPAELTQSATDAVRQWSYKPTLLNGEPVEVQTTVDVNYTLSQ